MPDEEPIVEENPIREIQREAQKAAQPPGARRTLRTLLFEAYLVIAMAGFLLLAFISWQVEYFPVDLYLTRLIQNLDIFGLPTLMIWVSWLGNGSTGSIVLLVLTGLIYLLGFRTEAGVALLAGLVSWGGNTVIKLIISRPRPAADLVSVARELDSFSFPSGHVMFYTGFFGFLFFLAFTELRSSWIRTTLLVLFGGLVLLVGPSRIFLGAHWASDVLGAYLASSLILFAIIETYRRLKLKREDEQAPQVEA